MQLTSDEIDLLVKNYKYKIFGNAHTLSMLINKDGIFSHFSDKTLKRGIGKMLEEREWYINRVEMLKKLKNL